MATKKPALNRGLNALLGSISKTTKEVYPTVEDTAVAVEEKPTAKQNSELRYLPLDLIEPGAYQPRQTFEPNALQELADSIRSQGVIQPIIVRAKKTGRYEIVAGERRWRAAQLAQLTTIPALVRELDDLAVIAMTLIENIQREQLNPMEEAQALQRLLQECALTHEQVAQAIGKSRTTVTNLLRLMNLDQKVQRMLEQGDLEMGHARALLNLTNAKQIEIAQYIVAKKLSVRETERLVQQQEKIKNVSTRSTLLDPNLLYLQQDLSAKIGAQVDIQHGKNGRGKLVVHYYDVDQLQGILEKFN